MDSVRKKVEDWVQRVSPSNSPTIPPISTYTSPSKPPHLQRSTSVVQRQKRRMSEASRSTQSKRPRVTSSDAETGSLPTTTPSATQNRPILTPTLSSRSRSQSPNKRAATAPELVDQLQSCTPSIERRFGDNGLVHTASKGLKSSIEQVMEDTTVTDNMDGDTILKIVEYIERFDMALDNEGNWTTKVYEKVIELALSIYPKSEKLDSFTAENISIEESYLPSINGSTLNRKIDTYIIWQGLQSTLRKSARSGNHFQDPPRRHSMIICAAEWKSLNTPQADGIIQLMTNGSAHLEFFKESRAQQNYPVQELPPVVELLGAGRHIQLFMMYYELVSEGDEVGYRKVFHGPLIEMLLRSPEDVAKFVRMLVGIIRSYIRLLRDLVTEVWEINVPMTLPLGLTHRGRG